MPIISMLPTSGIPDQVIEQNKGAKQKFWVGTKAELDTIAERDANTLYIVTDDEGSVGGGDEDKLKELETALAGKVSKTGDNMTGVLGLGESGTTRGYIGAGMDSTNAYAYLAAAKENGRSFRLQLETNLDENTDDAGGITASLYKLWNGGYKNVGTVLHSGNVGNYALPLHGWQAATDFDTLTASGIYQCQGVNLNTPYGSSVDTHFYIVVLRNSDHYIRQIAYDVRGQNCYTRVKVNGAWYAWQQIALGSDLAAKQDASTAITTGNIGSQTVNQANYASITDPGTASLKNIKAGTSDLTAGSSALTTGDIYLVYE